MEYECAEAMGDEIEAGSARLAVVARSLRWVLPGRRGAVVWVHPRAVAVRTVDGREFRLPVFDATRRGQVVLLATGFLGMLLLWSRSRSRSRESRTADGP